MSRRQAMTLSFTASARRSISVASEGGACAASGTERISEKSRAKRIGFHVGGAVRIQAQGGARPATSPASFPGVVGFLADGPAIASLSLRGRPIGGRRHRASLEGYISLLT